MAGEVDVPAMNGLLKRVYDPKLGDLRPKSSILQRQYGFENGNKVGESYQVGVCVQAPNGYTYVGSTGVVKPLQAPSNSVIKQASITPFEAALREQVAWTAMSRAAETGEQAIKALTGELVIAMKNSMANRLEASLLHGQRGYGTIESVAAAASDAAITFTAATWAPGMWQAFGSGSRWDAFTGTTLHNASGQLVVKGINGATRTVTVSYTGTLANEMAAGDKLFPRTAYAGSTNFDEMPGLIKQASNTTGVSLGIDAAVYPNWAGNLQDVAGANPSHGVVEELLANLRDRGAEGALTVYVSNKMFSNLAVELAQFRQLDSSYKEKGQTGFRSLSYLSPDVDEVKIVNHPFMMQGELLILPDSYVTRVGSSDITFGVPGMPDGMDLVQYVNGFNAAELGMWTDQAGLLKRPNWALVATGFAYT